MSPDRSFDFVLKSDHLSADTCFLYKNRIIDSISNPPGPYNQMLVKLIFLVRSRDISANARRAFRSARSVPNLSFGLAKPGQPRFGFILSLAWLNARRARQRTSHQPLRWFFGSRGFWAAGLRCRLARGFACVAAAQLLALCRSPGVPLADARRPAVSLFASLLPGTRLSGAGFALPPPKPAALSVRGRRSASVRRRHLLASRAAAFSLLRRRPRPPPPLRFR